MNFNPEGIQIKRLSKRDLSIFKNLIQLFNEVFEEKHTISIKESYLKKLLKKPGFIAYVLMYENRLAGGLTAYELPMYNTERDEIFIYDMAILPEFQRKGFGTELIESLKEYGRKNGISEIFVAAHEKDKHALDFYRSTGGKAEKVIHFVYDPNS
jgi:aminoglycoside 3-N-acetyltransferase I